MSTGISDDSHELSDMSQGKAREANVEVVAESIDRDGLDRDQLAKLGKKSVLKVCADFPQSVVLACDETDCEFSTAKLPLPDYSGL